MQHLDDAVWMPLGRPLGDPPHPQQSRPNTSVERIASTKNTNPALTVPSRSVYMLSLGSTGETVRPVMSHCAMCAAMST